MGGRGGGSSVRSPIVVAQQTLADREAMADMDIRDAFEDVANIIGKPVGANEQNPWVSLLRLRTALAVRGWDRERQDRELRRFIRDDKGGAVPENNQKSLSQAQRDAAIRMGGQDKHLFTVLKQ